ncbi:ras-domain-containing protein [Pholiota molesta]|nr:ras-domain-containing protein [Pholiota molesta]
MPTVKLVVIGSSGVGKTSLRGKYIEGHFSTGYRATIGATSSRRCCRTPPTRSSRSLADMGHGRPGALLEPLDGVLPRRGRRAAMFDVNAPETMHALTKWWADFCARAPLPDADMHDYCCVVVGNKIDAAPPARRRRGRVSASEALEFVDELVPGQAAAGAREGTVQVLPPEVSDGSPEMRSHLLRCSPPPPRPRRPSPSTPSSHPPHHAAPSASSSSAGHEPTAAPALQIALALLLALLRGHDDDDAHDAHGSARASPEPPEPPPPAPRQRTLTMLSTGSTSSGSAPTITPSLIARERAGAAAQGRGGATPTQSSPAASAGLPPRPPERGPRLFFTSAKTGEGVPDVFEYVARRVVQKWAYDEWVEARAMHFREASAAAGGGPAGGGSATVRLLQGPGGRWGSGGGWGGAVLREGWRCSWGDTSLDTEDVRWSVGWDFLW